MAALSSIGQVTLQPLFDRMLQRFEERLQHQLEGDGQTFEFSTTRQGDGNATLHLSLQNIKPDTARRRVTQILRELDL
jgi:enoyl reductase-like protein